ncbi:hypothetical protein ACTGVV_06125, partial [Streptococcus suis]
MKKMKTIKDSQPWSEREKVLLLLLLVSVIDIPSLIDTLYRNRPITKYIEKAPKSYRLWNLFLFTCSLNFFLPWQISLQHLL